MIIVALIATALFGVLTVLSFYYAFKPYKNDDVDYLDIIIFDYIEVLAILFVFIDWFCNKLFPKHHLVMFRIFMFINGILLTLIIALFWYFVYTEPN